MPAKSKQVGDTAPHVNGYILEYVGTSTPGNHCGYRLQHRVVIERQLGRLLKRTEQVHHINRDKTDNRPENLELLDIRDHQRVETAALTMSPEHIGFTHHVWPLLRQRANSERNQPDVTMKEMEFILSEYDKWLAS